MGDDDAVVVVSYDGKCVTRDYRSSTNMLHIYFFFFALSVRIFNKMNFILLATF